MQIEKVRAIVCKTLVKVPLMADRHNFNENTRVQIPAAMHLVRLGYTYFNRINANDYDHRCNVLLKPLKLAVGRLNPQLSDAQVDNEVASLLRTVENDDLGQEFYQKITATSGIRYIDFESLNNPEHHDQNVWHVTTEFTCLNERTDDNFRPDITVFVNGLPLVFIEVKKPFNVEGILAERSRIDARMRNKAFRSFFNVTQFMVFSNNEEYNEDSQVPISGAFYATPSRSKAFFNVFREEDKELLQKSGYHPDVSDAVEHDILIHRNCPQLKALPEYKTNQQPTTPTNRILTSMLSRQRLLFILRYGIAYVKATHKNKDGETVTEQQKHIMRYQQLFATYAIRRTLDKGLTGGIIWHTQGSGKTALSYYNVKSLTDYFALRSTPVKFYFIVDRLDLLEQASSEFSMRGLVVRTAQSREELMADFADNTVRKNPDGKPEIMVVNIQKFATDHKRINKKEVYNTHLRRIFFIDEAHRGYDSKGCFLANLFQADPNAIKIALTGTPLLKSERESWRVFGDYIHTYYYDKSIADGYTLKLMREDIETIYKEQISNILDQLTGGVQVKKSDIDHNQIIENESYLMPVLQYIVRDLRRSRIQQDAPHMGGMIVCETNQQAREIYRLLDEREFPTITTVPQSPQEIPNDMAAQPREVEYNRLRPVLILHDEGDKLERKGNIDLFKKTEDVDFLVVNAMLLTGFDAPRLKKLYLLRKLDGHNLLQALTRVNRPYRDFKYGYVVDFANIKENFIDTNNRYLRELNRTNEEDVDTASGNGAGNALMLTNQEIALQMQGIREALFQYSIENVEEFSRQIEGIDDKEQLYSLRRTLEDARALTNQVRTFGNEDLRHRFEVLSINSIPSLISEVTHRIQRVNLLEATDHRADVSSIIREALSMLDFEFKKRGDEELEMVYNDLRDRYDRVEQEFAANIDHEEDAYVTLSADFRNYFKRRGFTPDSVDAAREDIGYMDEVLKKIKKINRANAVLQAKYNNDEKFARIHKRVREENKRRDGDTPPGTPIISRKDIEIADALRAFKHGIDEGLYLNSNLIENPDYFGQDVMSEVATSLTDLRIAASRTDRQWIKNRIAAEYLNSFGEMK